MEDKEFQRIMDEAEKNLMERGLIELVVNPGRDEDIHLTDEGIAEVSRMMEDEQTRITALMVVWDKLVSDTMVGDTPDLWGFAHRLLTLNEVMAGGMVELTRHIYHQSMEVGKLAHWYVQCDIESEDYLPTLLTMMYYDLAMKKLANKPTTNQEDDLE